MFFYKKINNKRNSLEQIGTGLLVYIRDVGGEDYKPSLATVKVRPLILTEAYFSNWIFLPSSKITLSSTFFDWPKQTLIRFIRFKFHLPFPIWGRWRPVKRFSWFHFHAITRGLRTSFIASSWGDNPSTIWRFYIGNKLAFRLKY